MFKQWPDETDVGRVWNYQVSRLIAEAHYGGGYAGEIYRTVAQIRLGNVTEWYQNWFRLAETVEALAEDSLALHRSITARSHFLRAFNYYRTAEFVLAHNGRDRETVYSGARRCFAAASRLFLPPAEAVTIPYGTAQLYGYRFRATSRIGLRPIILFISGADALPEENLFRGVTAITDRGMDCLLVNFPGQGSALRLQQLPSRYDFEVPVSAALDWVADCDDIDQRAIGLWGQSMGGYYAPRAAAFESRIAAMAVCGALYDVLRDLYENYPPLRSQLEWVVGADDAVEARSVLRDFTLEGAAKGIKCPTLIVHGEDDRFVPVESAYRLYDEIVGQKELVVYPSGGPGAEHGQMDHRAVNIPNMVDWLKDCLDNPSA